MDANKLKETIEATINKTEYQPGYPNWYGRTVLKLPLKPGSQPDSTWCIIAAWEILKNLGYDVDLIVKPRDDKAGIWYTTPDEMEYYAENGARNGKIKIITEQEAQDQANNGIGVLVCATAVESKTGHIAVVAPGKYDPQNGCTVGQAGGENGIFSRVRGFGPPGKFVSFPKFYLLPMKG